MGNRKRRSGKRPERRDDRDTAAPQDSVEDAKSETDVANVVRRAMKGAGGGAAVVLLAGLSEADKQKAVEAVASEAERSIDHIDLSKVAQKYIGETEKNLASAFAEASEKGWILFFDEADALFGKRTAVKNAHDRYANQEVSYLTELASKYDVTAVVALRSSSGLNTTATRNLILIDRND